MSSPLIDPAQPHSEMQTQAKAQLPEAAQAIAQAMASPTAASEAVPSRRPASAVERILSPQTLQRMMACGGGILVIGLIGWLWSIGLFENPVIVAGVMGGATFGVLALGLTLIRHTQCQLAGKGMTLLACLAMPLNLWLYDAQGLATIADGGHLWIPAAFFCAVYALVARTLRRPVCVYAFVGGIVLTGMLLLADEAIGHFWELLPQASLLVVTGWLCLASEYLFPMEGDFSQAKFGRAFRRSGFVVAMCGLALIAGGQLFAWSSSLIGSVFDTPLIATDHTQKLWALGLLVGSTLISSLDGYFGKSKPGRFSGIVLSVSILLGGWSVLTWLDLLLISPRLPHIAIASSMIIVLVKLTSRFRDCESDFVTDLVKAATVSVFGLALVQFFVQFLFETDNLLFSTIGWTTITQLATAALACLPRNVEHVEAKQVEAEQVEAEQRDTKAIDPMWGITALLATCALLSVIGALQIQSIAYIVGLGLLAPSSFLVAAFTLSRRPSVTPASPNSSANGPRAELQVAASVSLTTQLIFCVTNASAVYPLLHPMWAVYLLVVAAGYFLAGVGRRSAIERVLSLSTTVGAVCQLSVAYGLSLDYAVATSSTVIGVVLLVANGVIRRVAPGSDKVADAGQGKQLASSGFWDLPANVMILAGCVLTTFLCFSRVVTNEAMLGLLTILGLQLFAVTVAGLSTKATSWRKTFRAAAVAIVGTAIVVGNSLMDTHWLNQLELGAVACGLACLFIGHLAWIREGESKDASASVGLSFGSILTCIPLAIGLVFHRLYLVPGAVNWMLIHEVATIVAALGLFGAGIACRIRSTTIAGATLLSVYLLSLITLVQWPSQLQSVSIVMMAGGGLFFVLAVLLSVFREKLIRLPQQVRDGQGMFRVLRWR